MYNFNKNIIFGKVVLTLTLFAIFFTASSQEYQVRIACMGNSITFGAGLANPATESYPAQLGKMLQEKFGDTCVVGNYGNSGKTMLKHGDAPLWNEVEFTNAMAYAPNICLILLGTNDSKPQNWDFFGDEFYGDYMSMIDTFRVRNPFVKFIVCYPPPAFSEAWGIRDSVIVNGVIPAITQVLENTDAILVDFYTPLVDSVSLFPDNIHPNVQGSKVMAEIIYNKIIETDLIHNVETGLPFVTKLTSERQFITVNDTTTIEWEAINTNIVFFNGEMVSPTGSVIVSPDENTVYTMIAKNDKYSDTVNYEITVYEPIIDKISLSTSRTVIYEGDTCILSAKYLDQYKYPISDMVVKLEWTVFEGEGQFFDEGDNSTHFTSNVPGLCKIQAGYGDVAGTINVRVKEKTTGITVQKNNSLNIQTYPNPAGDYIIFKLAGIEAQNITVEIIDLKGTICISKELNKSDEFRLNLKDLNQGVYIYNVHVNNNIIRGKLVKGN